MPRDGRVFAQVMVSSLAAGLWWQLVENHSSADRKVLFWNVFVIHFCVITFIMLAVYLALLLLNGYVSLPAFKQGYGSLFVKEAKIHTSSHSWTISFELNITSYIAAATGLYDSINQYIRTYEQLPSLRLVPMELNMSDSYNDLLHKEYLALFDVLEDTGEIVTQLENLIHLCTSECHPKDRRKRSLFPQISSLFELIFGFGTKKKQDLIKEKLRNLQASNHEIVHALAHSMTIIDHTSAIVVQNRELLSNVTDVLSNMAHSYEDTLDVIENNIIPHQRVSFRAIQLLTAKQTFQHAYNKLSQNVGSLQFAVSDLFSGVVTSNLLDPLFLLPLLEDIKSHLAPGLDLAYDLDDSLYLFYKSLHVHILPSTFGFLVTLTVPLKDSISTFSIYSVKHIPVHLNVNGTFINRTAEFITDHSYIGVSEDSTRIMFLDPSTLHFCLARDLQFCLINTPTYVVALLGKSCLVNLFFGLGDINQVCATKIKPGALSHAVATFISFNVYAITTAQEMTFTILCPSGSYDITIQPPVHILKLPNRCDARSSLLSLTNSFRSHSDLQLPSPTLDLREVSKIWDPVFKSIEFTEYKHLPHKLPEVMIPHTSVSSLAEFLTPPKLPEKNGLPWYVSILITLFVLIFVLISGIVFYFYWRKCLARKVHDLLARPSAPNPKIFVPTTEIPPTLQTGQFPVSNDLHNKTSDTPFLDSLAS